MKTFHESMQEIVEVSRQLRREWHPTIDRENTISSLRFYWILPLKSDEKTKETAKQIAELESESLRKELDRHVPVARLSWGYESMEMDGWMACVIWFARDMDKSDNEVLSIIRRKGFKPMQQSPEKKASQHLWN